MSFSANYPTITSSLTLDFANSKSLDPRITFTRASTGTYYDSKGVLTLAASGVPRFDHNPSTLESLGLLIEEQRQNLLTYSEELDNAAWTKNNATITPNATFAPDGAATADALIENTATSTHQTTNSVTYATNTAYTLSCFAKAYSGTRRLVLIMILTGGGFVTATFDLSTLAVSQTTGGTNPFTFGSTSAVRLSDGWLRLSVTATSGATAGAGTANFRLDNGTVNNYTGDGSSGLLVWGAQLETGSFPTSYIPTTTSAATRNADIATMTGTNFSNWFNQTSGAFLITHYSPSMGLSGYPCVLHAGVGTTGNRGIQQLYNDATDDSLAFSIFDDTPTYQGIGSFPAITPGTKTSVAAAYAANDCAMSLNGAAAVTDASVTLFTGLNKLAIGASVTGAQQINSCIAKIVYYSIRLSNTQLRALSS